MQILHEMKNPVFCKKNKKNVKLSSAELANQVVKINY